MNWKTAALRSLRWKLLLLGAAAGVWGSLLHELALLLPGLQADAPTAGVVTGGALGLGLGLWLAPADALLRQLFRRAAQAAVVGAALGALGGALGGALQAVPMLWSESLRTWVPWAPPAWLSGATLVLMLGLIAAGSGVAAGAVDARRGRVLTRGLLGGSVGTLLAAPAVALAQAAGFHPWAVLAVLAAWSALLALALHGWGKRRARRWLRLLSSPGEDEIYPLQGGAITLGKHEHNDIPLPRFQEIYPYHCELRWSADHYDIVDNEQGGVVLVNYRQVQEHTLRSGDLIKIGSALLQYGEAS